MTAKPFVLSVKVVIQDARGRFLVLRRSARSKVNPGKWEFPGGKIDPGEAFDAALLREVEEETGLSILLRRVLGTTEYELPDRKVAYLIMEGGTISEQVRLSPEHEKFAWVERRNLAEMEFPSEFQTFSKTLAGVSDAADKSSFPSAL
jgi:8-oxo-dGTP diphosphatase